MENADIAGQIIVPASLLWGLVIAAGGSLVTTAGTLGLLILKRTDKHTEKIVDLHTEALKAVSNNTIALNRIADIHSAKG